MLKLFLLPLLILSFTDVDHSFRYSTDYTDCRLQLEAMLPRAEAGRERAEVLWRLARIELMDGEKATDKATKRAHFNQGVRYAEEGIKEDPKNEQCYMWHCANVGRESMTHGLAEQAKSASVIQKDLTTILDKLGKSQCSEAWQGLSEFYWKHPLKSKESAVNYARKAACTIPAGELRLNTYLHLAQLLQERDWSKEKRAGQVKDHAAKFAKAKSNTEKYALYDGSGDKLPWLKDDQGEYSDREEAEALIHFALGRYASWKDLTPLDEKDYRDILAWQKKMK